MEPPTPESPPKTLAYLNTIEIERVKGLAGKRAKAMRDNGINSVADLLAHAPRRYIDRSQHHPLSEVPLGEEVTVFATVKSVSTRRARRGMVIVEAVLYDRTGILTAVWFNQGFRARQLTAETQVALSGKVDRYRGALRMSSPAVDVLDSPGESLVTGRVMPIHPTVGGVRPGYLRRAIHNAIGRARPIADPVPPEILDRLDLIDRDAAIAMIHFPETMKEKDVARRRLVFDELFRLEIALAVRKYRQIEDAVGIAHSLEGPLVDAFIGALPFALTGAQRRTIDEIQADLVRDHPMHRLLQGEVGSGKTVVAVATLLTGVQSGFQGAVMAPTEVLAGQHYLGIKDLLEGASMAPPIEDPGAPDGMESLFAIPDDDDASFIALALLTSNSAEVNFRPPGGATRAEVLKWIAEGRVDVIVGTHSLIQEGVEFDRLGVAVVDEQHRFGVYQRVMLRDKAQGYEPDLLIMTATPIPRTLAMTLYGDLDVSMLDEMPPGRTPVSTRHVSMSGAGIEGVYDLIRSEVVAGRQAFVVCPLVEDSDKLEVTSATAEYNRLSAVFDDLRVGLLHGQLRPADKDDVMHRFRAGTIDILVATTVIEVGIDIPNATVMLIEDADRFGLSQLHQLRGRVGRGEHPGTCILAADPTTGEGEQRIAAMVASTDGFRLAEEDLRIRGQGTVFGVRQAGIKDLKLADILRDADVLVAARREAFALVAGDPDLADHKELRDEVVSLLGEDAEWLFIS